MAKIRILELSGTPYEMGYQHGKHYADDIRHFTEDRLQLCTSDYWTGQHLLLEEVIALADACLDEHRKYTPDLIEELQGIADATDLGLPELIVTNGFTDFVDVLYNAKSIRKEMTLASDNCTAFLVPNRKTGDHHGFFGQTWDMHDSATPYVILLKGKPDDAPEFLAFTIIGCVGMIGMNSEGLAIGINNLMGGDGQIGVTWTFVIRKALQQSNIEDALDCILSAKLAGAHNYLLFDKNGNGYNVEAMSTKCHIDKLTDEAIVHTNHCLIPETLQVERQRPADSQKHSEHRLSATQATLAQDNINVDNLMELTRNAPVCTESTPPALVETCGATIMRPATGDFWAVWGLPSENDYEHFTI